MKIEPKHRRQYLGFTLIELMIVVAIVGILAAIAYPSYQRQVLRTHRTEGLSTLQQIAARQERYYSNNSTYGADLATLGVSASTEHGYFTIAISDAPCNDISLCYTLTAAAQGAQTNDTGCTTLTLTSSGQKAPAVCWGN